MLSVLFLRQDPPRPGLRFDAVGAVLSTLAFGITLYGLTQVSDKGWGSIEVQGLLGVGLFCLVAFIGWELTRDQPLLDVRLFSIPQFAIANVVGWVSTIALFGAEFLLPLYLQNLPAGLSAMETGLLLLPQGLAGIAGPVAGRLTDRIGAHPVVMFGFLLLAFNTWQLSQITLTTSFSEIRWLLIARGLALGCTMQPTQLTAMAVVPPRLRTNASSLNNALRGVFQSFGIAMLSTIVATQAVVHTTQLSWQVRSDTTQGVFLTQASALLQQAVTLPVGSTAVAAVTVVVGQIRQQATVLAFGNAYHVTFIAALVALGLAVLLPGSTSGAGAGRCSAGAH